MQRKLTYCKQVPQDFDKTVKQCTDAIEQLVSDDDPKSNVFALCIICNSEWETRISIKSKVSALDLAELVQPAIDQLWARAKGN